MQIYKKLAPSQLVTEDTAAHQWLQYNTAVVFKYCKLPPPPTPEGWGSEGHVYIENRRYMFTLLVHSGFFCIVNLDSFDV